MSQNDAFQVFMQKYQNMVFSTAVRLLGNETEAEDISQEVFLKAFTRFSELCDSPTVAGWLKTVATNLCLNHLSRYRNRWRFFSQMASAGGEEDSDFSEHLASDCDIEASLSQADDQRFLEGILQKLPPVHRVPLTLYHFESKTYEEISALMNISLAKVKTDIFRARAALYKQLRLHSEKRDFSGGSILPVRKQGEVQRRLQASSVEAVEHLLFPLGAGAL